MPSGQGKSNAEQGRRLSEGAPTVGTAAEWVSRGDDLLQQRCWAEAFDAFAAAATADPFEFDAIEWNARGDQFRQGGQLEFAQRAYVCATEQDPENPEMWYRLGTFLKERGDRDGALHALQRASEADGGFIAGFLEAGTLCIESGQVARGLELLERAKMAQLDNALPWRHIGGAHYSQGSYEEAQKAFEQAIALDPQNAETWNMLGNSFYKQEKLDEALRSYNRAIEKQSSVRTGSPYHNISYIFLKRRRFKEAVIAIDQALEIARDDSNYWNTKTLIFTAAGNIELQEIDSTVDRALEVAGEDLELRITLAGCLAQYGRLDRARELIKDVVPGALGDEDARLGLVENLLVTGAFDKAVDLLNHLDSARLENSLFPVVSFYRLLLQRLTGANAEEPFASFVRELQQRVNERTAAGHSWRFLSIPWVFGGVRRFVRNAELPMMDKCLLATLIDLQEGALDPAGLSFFAPCSVGPQGRTS
jgi:tetratricopeptide (TPR) repeat protein